LSEIDIYLDTNVDQARALQAIDIWSLDVKDFDGAALEPNYKPPPFNGPEPEVEFAGGKIYKGACHCGAVTMALKTRGPLSKEEEVIGECNCSICARVRLPSALILSPPTSAQILQFSHLANPELKMNRKPQ
jgi:hypothetical protein